MANIAKEIKSQQKRWARAQGIDLDDQGYCLKLEDNLFWQYINPETRDEIARGYRRELTGKEGRQEYMYAPHGSMALACNFFDYWRCGKDAAPLAYALGVSKVSSICFREKFRTGLPGKPPHASVVLHLASGKLLAIDSRFTERFSSPKKNPLGKSYFSDGKEPWRQAGLPCCQELAENLSDGHRDVAHILRHMLGLANSGKNWQMLYLWFDPGGAESKIHQEEIDEFINAIKSDGEKFRAMTYQSLFDRMSEVLDTSHEKYRKYLKERYFRHR